MEAASSLFPKKERGNYVHVHLATHYKLPPFPDNSEDDVQPQEQDDEGHEEEHQGQPIR